MLSLPPSPEITPFRLQCLLFSCMRLAVLLGRVTHSIQQILSTYYVQSTGLGTGGTAMNLTGKKSLFLVG